MEVDSLQSLCVKTLACQTVNYVYRVIDEHHREKPKSRGGNDNHDRCRGGGHTRMDDDDDDDNETGGQPSAETTTSKLPWSLVLQPYNPVSPPALSPSLSLHHGNCTTHFHDSLNSPKATKKQRTEQNNKKSSQTSNRLFFQWRFKHHFRLPEILSQMLLESTLFHLSKVRSDRRRRRGKDDNKTLPRLEQYEWLIHKMCTSILLSVFYDHTKFTLQRLELREVCIPSSTLYQLLYRHKKLAHLDVRHCSGMNMSVLASLMKRAGEGDGGVGSTATTIGTHLSSLAISQDIVNKFGYKDAYDRVVCDRGCCCYCCYSGADETSSFEPSKLKSLTIGGLSRKADVFFYLTNSLLDNFFQAVNFENLTHLDLSWCTQVYFRKWPEKLTKLVSLRLYDTFFYNDGDEVIDEITKIKTLKFLDISEMRYMPRRFSEYGFFLFQSRMFSSRDCLRRIIERLPQLIHLDISGTNLVSLCCNRESNGCVTNDAAAAATVCDCVLDVFASRMTNPLEVLGLVWMRNQRGDIMGSFFDSVSSPAKKILGHTNEDVILNAIDFYTLYQEQLLHSLVDLCDYYKTSHTETVERQGAWWSWSSLARLETLLQRIKHHNSSSPKVYSACVECVGVILDSAGDATQMGHIPGMRNFEKEQQLFQVVVLMTIWYVTIKKSSPDDIPVKNTFRDLCCKIRFTELYTSETVKERYLPLLQTTAQKMGVDKNRILSFVQLWKDTY